MKTLAALLLFASPCLADTADEIRIAMAMADAKPQPAPKAAAPAATHSHRCPRCGTTWAHADDSYGKVADHTCPQCGALVWRVYQRWAASNAKPAPVAPTPAMVQTRQQLAPFYQR